MKQNIIYIATKGHPGCICFLDQNDNKKEFKISAKLSDEHTHSISALLTCDNTDHPGTSRAEDVLKVAIHEYYKVHNVLPEHIELSWYGMASKPPSADDIQTARAQLLGLTSTPFSGIFNSTISNLREVSLFALTAFIAIAATWAYKSYQENTPR